MGDRGLHADAAPHAGAALTRGARLARLTAAAALLLLAAGRAAAQSRLGPVQTGVRLDVFVARITALQAGFEASVSGGRNLRLGLTGAGGVSWRDGASGASARVEATGRFILDPEFTQRWAPYAVAGLGVRYDRIGAWRGVVSLALGLEGPRWGGMVPFLEAGYGGGARLGAGLRRALPGRR